MLSVQKGGVWSATCKIRVWSAKCKVLRVERGVWGVKCGAQSQEVKSAEMCRVWSAKCRVGSAKDTDVDVADGDPGGG